MVTRVAARDINQRSVRIISVDPASGTCETLEEKSGARQQVSMHLMRAKGVFPRVGDTWIIDRTFYFWSLAAVINHDPPTITSLVDLGEYLDAAGIIKWEYDGSEGPPSGEGCCGEGGSFSMYSLTDMAPGAGITVALATVGGDSSDWYTAGMASLPFPSGAYTVSGAAVVLFAAGLPTTGDFRVSMVGNGFQTGGWVYGSAGPGASGGSMIVPISGTWYAEEPWTPGFYVNNNTNVTVTTVVIRLGLTKSCEVCGPVTIIPTGG